MNNEPHERTISCFGPKMGDFGKFIGILTY